MGMKEFYIYLRTLNGLIKIYNLRIYYGPLYLLHNGAQHFVQKNMQIC